MLDAPPPYSVADPHPTCSRQIPLHRRLGSTSTGRRDTGQPLVTCMPNDTRLLLSMDDSFLFFHDALPHLRFHTERNARCSSASSRRMQSSTYDPRHSRSSSVPHNRTQSKHLPVDRLPPFKINDQLCHHSPPSLTSRAAQAPSAPRYLNVVRSGVTHRHMGIGTPGTNDPLYNVKTNWSVPFSGAPKMEFMSATSLDYIGCATFDIAQAMITINIRGLNIEYPMDSPILNFESSVGTLRWIVNKAQTDERDGIAQETGSYGSVLVSEEGEVLARIDYGASFSRREGQIELPAMGLEQQLVDEIVVTGTVVLMHGKRMRGMHTYSEERSY